MKYFDRASVPRPKLLNAIKNEPSQYFNTPAVDLQTRNRDDIVFLTSRFRSGSTALWNAFRALEGVTAYYEPFNERQFFNRELRGIGVDSTHLGVKDYWREYDTTTGLSELYDENWIRRGLFMDENAWNPHMERFIERLIECADGRSVLQFNRIDFRLPWIRSRFPAAKIVHLYRNPREQWCSFLIDHNSFPHSAAPDSFPDHFYLRTWARDLQHVMPFLRSESIEHPYQLFYLIWKASYLFGRTYATTSIAFEELVDSPERVLSGLVDQLAINPSVVNEMKDTLVGQKQPRWPDYASSEWFEHHEAVCEHQLELFFLVKQPVSLVLSEIFPPKVGGSGQWLNEIYKRQPSERTVLLVGEHAESAEFDAESALRIERANLRSTEWTIMTLNGLGYFRRIYSLVAKLTKQYHVNEIHCARVIPEGVVGYAASTFLGLKLVCYVHGEDVELARRSRESRWLVSRVLKRSTRLICNSKNSRSMLTDDWNIDKAHTAVLHPGVDTELFSPSTDLTGLRQVLDWQERRVILTVSRLEKRKGHDKLIEALPEIVKRCPNVLYAIVGSGVEEVELKAQVTRLRMDNHVRFYGECNLDELVSFYRGCDLFALPNRQVGSSVEGFGIVFLEAQACAKPVIAGDSGGTAETLIPGTTGLVLDCTNFENLVGPLARILNDDSQRLAMGKAARSLMLEQFSWDSLAEKSGNVVFLDAE